MYMCTDVCIHVSLLEGQGRISKSIKCFVCVQGILVGYTPITFLWGKTNKRRKGY